MQDRSLRNVEAYPTNYLIDHEGILVREFLEREEIITEVKVAEAVSQKKLDTKK